MNGVRRGEDGTQVHFRAFSPEADPVLEQHESGKRPTIFCGENVKRSIASRAEEMSLFTSSLMNRAQGS